MKKARYPNLDALKEALGEKAYQQAKEQLEADDGRGVSLPTGAGSLLTRAAVRGPKLERHSKPSPASADALEEADTFNGILGPVIMWVQAQCYRERDVDDLSAKGVLDSLVTAGVLKGDSCETVIQVVKSIKRIPRTEQEKTVIKLYRPKV